MIFRFKAIVVLFASDGVIGQSVRPLDITSIEITTLSPCKLMHALSRFCDLPELSGLLIMTKQSYIDEGRFIFI